MRKLKAIMLVYLCCAVFAVWGCEPLRKKFTRKKNKDDSAAVQPILTPIDYPVQVYSAAEQYRQAFGLWKVWHRELIGLVDDPQEENEKRLNYVVAQELGQMEKIHDLLDGNDREAAQRLLVDMKELSLEFNRPRELRRRGAISKRLRVNEKTMMDKLTPRKPRKYTTVIPGGA
ncbi:MAG: hypothetical protein HQL23_07900 [Candidatus Omnitrophica bacterium]|nr:hypothetical protein [Candidatus Omnitrophota bacterium]